MPTVQSKEEERHTPPRPKKVRIKWKKLYNPATMAEFREVTLENIKQLTDKGLLTAKAFLKAMVKAAKATLLRTTPLNMVALQTCPQCCHRSLKPKMWLAIGLKSYWNRKLKFSKSHARPSKRQ
jgi:hypothetical protein